MFARVAPRYDFLNHLLSASLDRLWRRQLAEAMATRLGVGSRVADLCSGTGDQAVALRQRGFEVVASDFCLPMLASAPRKLRRLSFGRFPAPPSLVSAADALRLPFANHSFDGVTVSFGLRNVADLGRALDEIYRVLRPGGWLGVLEFGLPRSPILGRLYGFYFDRILPRVGQWFSEDPEAYRYLPASVEGFPQGPEFVTQLQGTGFAEASGDPLTGGVLYLYLGRRPT